MPMSGSVEKRCICPFGDRCTELVQGFSEQCGDSVAADRGGYVEVPPPGIGHLVPAPLFNVRRGGGSNRERNKDGKVLSPWEQIRRAYARHFHFLAEEAMDKDQYSDSGTKATQDTDFYVDINTPERLCVALHHFHPKITSIMKKGQQLWDQTPVWQCLNPSSLAVLLQGEDSDLEKQMIHRSNRIKMDESNHGTGMKYDFPSYVVLPNYPIQRAERDFERLKAMHEYNMAHGGYKSTTPVAASGGQGAADAHDDANLDDCNSAKSPIIIEDVPESGRGGRPVPQRSSSARSLPQLSTHSRMTWLEWREHRESYHEKLLSFERTRRAAADERLRSLLQDWYPRHQRLKDIVAELRRIDVLMKCSCGAMDKYTKSLQSWRIPDDIFANIASSGATGDTLKPLVTAFANIADEWQKDMPHLLACYQDFENLQSQAEAAIEEIQSRYTMLQHNAVSDEIAIRQAWCDFEELCIVDSVLQHRDGNIEDRWLRELTYRRWIVLEKTGTRSQLQPILDNVDELDKLCQNQIQEILLTFLPKHRRLFLQTRDKFDPALDKLEAGMVDQEAVEMGVEQEVTPPEIKEPETEKVAAPQPGFLSSVFGTPQKTPEENIIKEEEELEAEMTKLDALLRSVHIYEVQIVSFRVEQNTWVTSFCVITYQRYMHFFPLLPGTDFDSLRKEKQSVLAEACVSAWEKGSTPLLSVFLTSCSYGLSPDGTFIELIIATPPRKKIGLRVGSPEECEQWVHKTQQWVMLFSMK